MAELADAHVSALLALVAAAVTTYDAQVPDSPTLPYAVLYADLGTRQRSSLAATSGWLSLPFQVTGVGATRQQASWAADKARTALVDVAVSVSGRSCSPIVQESSQPVIRDDDVVPPVFYAVATYRLLSILA